MAARKLVFWGSLLFLLGLLEGLVVSRFANPRMGLSAHLAAVQSGLALMVFGLCWRMYALSTRLSAIAVAASGGGMYAVWLAITFAAVTGASKALPIAGAGHSASAVAEYTVVALVAVGGTLSIVGIALLVWGLFRGLRAPHPLALE